MSKFIRYSILAILFGLSVGLAGCETEEDPLEEAAEEIEEAAEETGDALEETAQEVEEELEDDPPSY